MERLIRAWDLPQRGEDIRLFFIVTLGITGALAASSVRFVVAPGFEFYLGPLFYLLAYRALGLRCGLLTAVVVMAPTVWWWGHLFTIGLSLAHLVFVDQVVRRRMSIANATLLFHATIGWVAVLVFMKVHYDASLVVIGTSVLRKVMLDLSLAIIVDVVALFLVFEPRLMRFYVRRTVSLAKLIETSMVMLLTITALMLFISEVRQFDRSFSDYQSDLKSAVALDVVDHPVEVQGRFVRRVIDLPPLESQQVVLGSGALPRPASLQAALGCTRSDDGAPLAGPDDRNTFAYWFAVCTVGVVHSAGKTTWYAAAMEPLAARAYGDLLEKMLAFAAVLAIALVIYLAINRALVRALAAWREAVGGFGHTDLTTPDHIMFTEFERPISSFIAANNNYTSAITERATLAQSVMELKSAIDLRLLRDIRYDETQHMLLFTDVDIREGAMPTALHIHPNDATAFANAATASEPIIEFRLANGAATDWYLLIARDTSGTFEWRSGCFLRLRRAKVGDQNILHQARLIELGGMASALSHELRQPLFTISLAAENGKLLAAQPSAPRAKIEEKFARVVEQVDRASTIIQRISRYARVDPDDMPPAPLIEAVNAAAKFMRPLLVEKNVQLRISRSWETRNATAPRVALEQILVNAIQNAVDAIVHRRETDGAGFDGLIEISVLENEGVPTIRIADNGTGLDPAIDGDVFDAFLTTKPAGKGTGLGLYICRQIMSELGGQVSIESKASPARGAVLSLGFARTQPKTPRQVEQLPA